MIRFEPVDGTAKKSDKAAAIAPNSIAHTITEAIPAIDSMVRNRSKPRSASASRKGVILPFDRGWTGG
jgi:hypothetical protein